MSKLDDIFEEAREDMLAQFENKARDPNRKPTKQQIKNLLLDLIGEDEVRPNTSTKVGSQNNKRKGRNQMRRILREKVIEL